mmetsp:Transcript_3066/g.6891  ORF Transcript_3066/g.6891 Transcript_3066/m.6891 type:complete len:119 (+) Transcript_3066:136-492(+)
MGCASSVTDSGTASVTRSEELRLELAMSAVRHAAAASEAKDAARRKQPAMSRAPRQAALSKGGAEVAPFARRPDSSGSIESVQQAQGLNELLDEIQYPHRLAQAAGPCLSVARSRTVR